MPRSTATTSREGLVAACDDRRLLAFPLWPRQRDLLAAVEDGPRLHVWALGRRSGKTTMTALVALWDALLRPDLDALVRSGERRYAVAVATNLRQARLFVRAALSIVERSPLLAREIRSASEDEIEFRSGATVAAFPCTSRGARGWPISTLVMDEAAHFISETEGPAVAERVFSSLAPSTAQFGDLARVIVSSTPYGSGGFFADLYGRVTGGEIEDALAFNVASAEANPTLDAALLDRERARDAEGFRSEYEAEFVGGGHAYLDPERIEAAVGDRRELPPEAARDWIAGLDPAFSSDPFGLAIVGRDYLDPERLVLGCAHAWRPARRRTGTFEERRAVEDERLAAVADVCCLYGVSRIATDQYAAPAVVDRLQRAGFHVVSIPMTAGTKTAAFGELRARLNLGSIELYEEPGLLAELRRLRTRLSAGSASVVNPRVGGSHGDMAQALALAVYEHDRYGVRRGSRSGASAGNDGSVSTRTALGVLDPRATGKILPDLGYGSHL